MTGCTYCSLHLNAAAQSKNIDIRTLGMEEFVLWMTEPDAPLPAVAVAMAAAAG